jgi:hypothetical protein
MRKLLIFILLVLSVRLSGQVIPGVVASGGAAVTSSSLLTGLVSAWELNESSGTITDSKGANNSSSCTATYGNTGKNGNCLTFTSSAIVTLANTTGWTMASTSSVSVSAWVYLTATQGSYANIIGNENGPQMYLALETSDPSYYLRFLTSGAATESTSQYTFTHSTWFHLLFVKSGTSTSLYVNNVLVGSGTEGTYSALSPAAIYIGNDGGAETFTGRIDMVRIWSKALSAGERLELYTKENTGTTTYPW